jgi:uncharacterized membrane protein YhaH (DUF805 family)
MSHYAIKIDYQPEFTISTEELINQIKDNRIPSTALVRKADTAEWQPLSSYPEFLYQTPPPLPKNLDQEQIISNAKLHEENKTPIPKYFMPIGRINGSIFFFRNIINFLCFSLITALINLLPESLRILVIIPLALWIYLVIITSAKRCHDWNITGWLSPLVFIPFIPLLFWLIPGNKYSNRFGERLNGVWSNLFTA